jgi:folylpolyglutamate synthase
MMVRLTFLYIAFDYYVHLDYSYKRKASPDIQKEYAEIWRRMDPDAQISLQPTIYDALELAKRIGDRANGMQTFVTGTTRLVRSTLAIV